jgi:isoleucyl-tRNA synthetase
VFGPELPEELLQVVLDELNAKSYGVTAEVGIDTELTSELIAEGAVRELMRAVQGKRKTDGLEPQDEIVLTVQTNTAGQFAIKVNQDLLQKTVGATELQFADVEGESVSTGEFNFTFSIA